MFMKQFASKPILSICIPTYNRSKYLKNCLDSIIIQEEFKKGFVEIVISDNASTDDTKEMVEKYVNEHDNIVYSKNTVNVRDKNFPKVLSLGNGTLRRLCNDTLVFHAGSLKYMCDIIKKYNITRPYLFWGNDQLTVEEIFETNSFEEFVLGASFWVTSIACFSIWDNECENIENDTEGVDLLLWQVRKCLELSRKKDGAIILNKGLAKVQSVERKNISYGLYNVFYTNYFKLLEPYFSSNILKANDRELLEKELLFDFFMDWSIRWELSNRNFKYSEEENLKSEIENRYGEKIYWQYYVKLYRKRKIKMTIMLFLKRIKKTIKYFGKNNEGREYK